MPSGNHSSSRTENRPAPLDTAGLAWFKSSSSNGRGGMCVEVAWAGERVAVRDSKNPQGPVLVFSQPEWDAFLTGARKGEFDIRRQPGHPH